MNVLRYDVVTVEDTPQTLFTVPANEAYTVVGFTIVETEGDSGEISLNISKQVNNEEVIHPIGQFGISGNDLGLRKDFLNDGGFCHNFNGTYSDSLGNK